MSRKIYNAVLGKLLRRLNQMRSSKAYRAALLLPKTVSGKVNEQRKEVFTNLRIEFSLNEYAANSLASQIRQSSMDFQLFVPSKVAQGAGKRAWGAVEKKMFGKSKRCRFKGKNETVSMRGNSNAEAPQIKFEGDGAVMIFKKRRYALNADKSPEYFKHAASCRVKNSIILKRKIKGEHRWFVQIALEGQAYRDSTKERKHEARLELQLGPDFKTQNVSVDFGPSRVAISNEKHSYDRKIVGQSLDAMILGSKRLQRAMSRSIRMGNREAFKAGKLKKGVKLKRSKNYLKLKDQKQDLDRQVAAYRKTIHGNIANEVCALGTIVKFEDISYKAMQKRYGKSIGKAAPASLQASLSRTAEKLGGRAELINTFQTRLSQTCLCGEIKKKALSERVHHCQVCGLTVPRDTLSAYLGCFTENTILKKGRASIPQSVLHLAQARDFAAGHQTLSSFGENGKPTSSSNTNGEPISVSREETPSLEVSKGRRGRAKSKSVSLQDQELMAPGL